MNGSPSILVANDADHSRGRKTLSHAFSEKALADQEGLLQKYVDQLVNRLKEVTSASPEPVNMVKWYNWTTFDVIADLSVSLLFVSHIQNELSADISSSVDCLANLLAACKI